MRVNKNTSIIKIILQILLLQPCVNLVNSQTPEIKITQLTDNVYQHISYKKVEKFGIVGASGLVVIEGNNAYIIDTPWSKEDTVSLLGWIRTKGFTVKSSISTHFHEDAAGGVPFLNDLSIKTYATSLTNKLLKAEGLEKANNEISDDNFVLVDGLIEVYYPGPGHTQDNIVIWLPKQKILFGGCLVKSLNNQSMGYTGDASIKDWPLSIQNLINKYPIVEVVVPGHGGVGDIRLLEHTKQLVLSVKAP